METQRYAAIVAVLFTVAITSVENRIGVFGVQRDEAEAVSNKLVGKHGGVSLDFDKIYSNGGHFGKDDTAEGVGEGEVDIRKGEVNGAYTSLTSVIRISTQSLCRFAYLSDRDSRPNLVLNHGIVFHGDGDVVTRMEVLFASFA